MKNVRRYPRIYLFEIVFTLLCVIGIVIFFRLRGSMLDTFLLALWGVLLLLFISLLSRGEIKLRHEEERSGSILDDDIRDGK